MGSSLLVEEENIALLFLLSCFCTCCAQKLFCQMKLNFFLWPKEKAGNQKKRRKKSLLTGFYFQDFYFYFIFCGLDVLLLFKVVFAVLASIHTC